MRVLHLTPELPFAPGGGGGETREFYLLRRLVELGHEVENVSPATAAQAEKVPLLEAAGVSVRTARRPDSQIEEVLRAMAAEPVVAPALLDRPWLAWQMRVFWSRIRALALQAIADHRPDAIVVGHDMALAWARDLPRDVPKVLTCHNLTWHYYLSRARASADPVRGALLRGEAARYRRHVLHELPLYEVAIAVSTLERDELIEAGRTRVEFIPSGVGTDVITPAPEPDDGPPRLLFTGTMSYLPNHQGITWFADEVWPLVRARVPNAELDVVGRNPPPSVEALDERGGITVHGGVPEVAPYFARSNAVIVPILTGAGIRVKIIEALAAGRATVSTPLGAEGLELDPGRNVLIAGGAQAFADAVVEVLEDPALRGRLGAEGRALAERRYDWRSLGDDLARVLESVCTSA